MEDDSEAYGEGYRAYLRFQSYDENASSANPHDDGTDEAADWERGWSDAAADNRPRVAAT